MSNEFNPNKNNSNNYNYYLFKIIHIVEPDQKYSFKRMQLWC